MQKIKTIAYESVILPHIVTYTDGSSEILDWDSDKLTEVLNQAMRQENMKPIVGQIYQHRYGGLYVVDDVATHTGNKERLVIYTHLFPFEHQSWARPIDEWTEERFKPITGKEYTDLSLVDPEKAKLDIGLNKGAGKSVF